jgi:hypothetical protein
VIEPNVAGGVIGGALIGISSVLMLLLLGRITGIAGILTGVITWNKADGLSSARCRSTCRPVGRC